MGSSFLDMTKVSHAQTDAEWLAKDGDSGALVLVGVGSRAQGLQVLRFDDWQWDSCKKFCHSM